jgi:predicted transposase/invertase (TIGR01784 family)
MAEIKNSMDRAQELLIAQEEAQEKGLAEGRVEGLAEGLAEGRAKILEIARKMKNAGQPLSEIAEFTGLPIESIEQM